jgi:hypothetical protein
MGRLAHLHRIQQTCAGASSYCPIPHIDLLYGPLFIVIVPPSYAAAPINSGIDVPSLIECEAAIGSASMPTTPNRPLRFNILAAMTAAPKPKDVPIGILEAPRHCL